jgi:hypothetical protein
VDTEEEEQAERRLIAQINEEDFGVSDVEDNDESEAALFKEINDLLRNTYPDYVVSDMLLIFFVVSFFCRFAFRGEPGNYLKHRALIHLR